MPKVSDSLCWSCSKACGGCSWSDHSKPIKGWFARKTKYFGNKGMTTTFEVKNCPEFIPDQKQDKALNDYYLDIDTGKKYRSYQEICRAYKIETLRERKLFSYGLRRCRGNGGLIYVKGVRLWEFGHVPSGRNILCVSNGKWFVSFTQAAKWVQKSGRSNAINYETIRKRMSEAASEQGHENFFSYGLQWRCDRARNAVLDL